jgi:hypothetical protein
MADQSVAPNVLIAAALIQGGQFKLTELMPTGTAGADADWRAMPNLVALRNASDVICRALSESLDAPDPDILGQIAGLNER